MKKQHLKYSLVFLVLVFCFCKCHHDDPNPCKDSKLITANFNISDNFRPVGYENLWSLIFCDTVISDDVLIIAEQDSLPGTQYIWTIGVGKYYKRQLSVNFKDRNQNVVPITLQVIGPKVNTCHPSDTLKQSFTKNIIFFDSNISDEIDRSEHSLLVGTYTGIWQNGIYDTLTIGKFCTESRDYDSCRGMHKDFVLYKTSYLPAKNSNPVYYPYETGIGLAGYKTGQTFYDEGRLPGQFYYYLSGDNKTLTISEYNENKIIKNYTLKRF